MTRPKQPSRRTRFDEDAFTDAFLAAEYPQCRRLLAELAGSEEAVILEAEVDFRESRFVEMIEPLTALKPKNPRIALVRDVLLGAAYGQTKDYTTARLRLDRAIDATSPGDQIWRDAVFYKGLVAWIEHEHRECEALAVSLLANASPNESARAHFLLSWVALRRRDVTAQVSELIATLDSLEPEPHPDEYYRSKALVSLSLLCRELPLPAETERIRDTAERMHWGEGVRLQHFQTTRHLGWIDALRGNELAAFREFRAAAALAPSEHWRVLCLTDRAYLARNTGEELFAEDLLNEAHTTAQHLSWHETPREERSALFVLAELFASIDPALSQKYLAQYRSLNTSVMPGISYTDDPRIRAFAGYSLGMASLQSGEKQEAIAALSEAREIFEAFHYGWRRALCALALHRATGDPKWLVEARHEIAPWPNSWIARDIAEAGDSSRGDDKLLSKAQRRVLNLLLEGKTNADIAAALGRSPNTVRNHMAQLFRTYGVSNRTQLAGLFRVPRRN